MIPIEDLPSPRNEAEGPRREAGRSLSVKLGVVRAELAAEGADPEALAMIDQAILEIVHWSKYSDRELENIMLDLIEDGVNVATDISSELGIDRRLVVETLNRLEARGRAYKVFRWVPGSDRPQFMYKSKRIRNVEALNGMCHVPGNWPTPEDALSI